MTSVDNGSGSAALATDPLVRDPATVQAMFDDLLAANTKFMGRILE
jgi:alpha-galactosidase/6-phospho-beta-glucosidase family protein